MKRLYKCCKGKGLHIPSLKHSKTNRIFKKEDMRKGKTTEEFISDATRAHADKYDYSKVSYVNNKTKIKVICAEHGEWDVLPLNHLAGHECIACSNTTRAKSLFEIGATKFIEQALSMEKHSRRGYTYANTVYRGALVKTSITCPKHGDFLTTPNNHLSGRGCPKCTKCGYNISKSGIFYILTSDCGLTKVGITNKKVSRRVSNISRTSGKTFKEVKAYQFDDGRIPLQIETAVLRMLRGIHLQPSHKFDGSTECFYGVNTPQLIEDVKIIIEEQHSSQSNASQEA